MSAEGKACLAGDRALFSLVSLWIPREEIRQERKRQTHRINLISDGATSCLAKSDSLFQGCPHSCLSLGLLTNGIRNREEAHRNALQLLVLGRDGEGHTEERMIWAPGCSPRSCVLCNSVSGGSNTLCLGSVFGEMFASLSRPTHFSVSYHLQTHTRTRLYSVGQCSCFNSHAMG